MPAGFTATTISPSSYNICIFLPKAPDQLLLRTPAQRFDCRLSSHRLAFRIIYFIIYQPDGPPRPGISRCPPLVMRLQSADEIVGPPAVISLIRTEEDIGIIKGLCESLGFPAQAVFSFLLLSNRHRFRLVSLLHRRSALHLYLLSDSLSIAASVCSSSSIVIFACSSRKSPTLLCFANLSTSSPYWSLSCDTVIPVPSASFS